MTYATDELKAARSLLIAELDMHPGSGAYPDDLDPAEVGIVGDTAHAQTGTSYHLGADQLGADAYSARTARDVAGLTNAASAVDVGEFEIVTSKGTFTHRDLAVWSVAQCRANAPDTRDTREIIYSPDGQRVFRYDRERGVTSAPTERIPADSHRWHNHYSQYRDATKAGRTTLLAHFTRWLTEIGAIDDMALDDKVYDIRDASGKPVTPRTLRQILIDLDLTNLGTLRTVGGRLDAILAAALDDNDTTVVLGPEALAELQAVRSDLAALPTAAADAVVATFAGKLGG